MRLVERLPVALGTAVAALVLWLTGYGWWAFGVFAAGLYLSGRIGPRLDPERLFPPDERKLLFERAGGRCQWCNRPIHYESECPFGECRDDYQADHVVAWSKGGRTMLSNGQALCRNCNGRKSNH